MDCVEQDCHKSRAHGGPWTGSRAILASTRSSCSRPRPRRSTQWDSHSTLQRLPKFRTAQSLSYSQRTLLIQITLMNRAIFSLTSFFGFRLGHCYPFRVYLLMKLHTSKLFCLKLIFGKDIIQQISILSPQVGRDLPSFHLFRIS